MRPIPEVAQVDIAFGNIKHIPSYSQIPAEFKGRSNKWCQLFSQIFFSGGKGVKLTPKEGVDHTKALRAIRAIMVSFDPSHEHKEAACAYLFSEWFEDWKKD
jgi:hypothetical protein